MLVILFDPLAQRTAKGSRDSELRPTTELLNRPFCDSLAEEYRRIGARDVLWADLGGERATDEARNRERPWKLLDLGAARNFVAARCKTVLIADYRLWPDEETKRAIRRHKRSSSAITALARLEHGNEYLEVIEDSRSPTGCTVTRHYGGSAPSANARRPVALLVRRKLLRSTWGALVEGLRSGDLDSLMALAALGQVCVIDDHALVDSTEDYLLLTERLLSRRDAAVSGARPIGDGVWAMRGASLHSDSRVTGPVLLGEGCRIGRGVRIAGPAVVGNQVDIGDDCFVSKSVLLSGAILPRGARTWHSVIDSSGRLEAGQSLSFAWANKEGCRHWTPAHSQAAFASVIVPSKRSLRRCNLLLFSALKRSLDILGAVVGLAITLPFYPIIALAIKLDSRGPVFFIHRRQTRGGKEFGCIKFRAMVKDAHAIRQQFANEVDGPQFHIADDPRLTRVGRFLKNTNLDEIPQLWNVLFGHMSLVGPRPSPDDENQFCPAWREARLSVRPGLTGMWQLRRSHDRSAGDFHEWIQYDTQYVRETSIRTDLKLIWETIRRLLGRARRHRT